MRFLPTAIHAAIDYVWGVLLIGTPFLFGFAGDAAAFWIAILFGLGGIAYSLATAYEGGAFKLIPMPVHLALDAVAGLALASSPILIHMDPRARGVFVAFGLFAVVASLVTRTIPRQSRSLT